VKRDIPKPRCEYRRDEPADRHGSHEMPPDTDRLPANDEPEEPSDLDEIEPDDDRWDAFIADDDERDPQPEYGDFWPQGNGE
jgi:hypothetical protein